MEAGSVMKKPRKTYKGVAMEGIIAKWYARTTKRDMEGYRESARIVAERLKAGDVVLELAPGPGYLAIELSKLGNYKIYGLDISETFVRIASENANRAGVNVDFRRGDATFMPFPNNFFDFIVCKAAFKNFTEPVRVLNEMYRILRTNGRAVIFDMRPDVPKAVIDETVKKMHLGRISSLMTKFSLNGLKKIAHSKSEFKEFIAQTDFHDHQIHEDPMGLAVWLEK
jgi:ubiquinone/menaquinone biosynthesis C-methylase UbiE